METGIPHGNMKKQIKIIAAITMKFANNACISEYWAIIFVMGDNIFATN